MFNFLRKDKSTFAMQAKPLSINPLPRSEEAMLRNISRVLRLTIAWEKADKNKDVTRMAAFMKEITRRRLLSQAAGTELPKTVEALEVLVKEKGS